ncbi:MAG TPA: alternative ribosome rescue aminoacyl-tRNA hydrolase ArfB [Gemmata sp.]|nr:alternative ribosome rescue aminoacyl-tRNA hydrolase ArfB [Gemmata sp.]
MFVVTDRVRIPDEELEWTYARSGGPGGQNVNKVASKAQLRWRASATAADIPGPARERMRARHPGRFTAEGDVVIQSQAYRDQERNREECLGKLADMIRTALVEPKPRKATKPTKGSQRRRLADKKRQSAKKQNRRAGGDD